MSFSLAKKLFSFNFAYQVQPFEITLQDGSCCQINEMIHLVPQTRLLAFGKWQNKDIFIKIFFDPQKKKLHYDKDLYGINILKAKQINTPSLYHFGQNQDKEVYIIMFERLMNCQTLFEMCRQSSKLNKNIHVVKQVVEEIAHQHSLGILQADPNAKNYLIHSKQIYAIDGTQIKYQSLSLEKKASFNNLVIFFSHFGLTIKKHAADLLNFYCIKRNWILSEEEKKDFLSLLDNRFKNGIERLQRKIFVKNRNFFPVRTHKLSGLLDRRYATHEMLEFLSSMYKNLLTQNAVLVKNKKNIQLYKVKIGQRMFVIKKIKSKNFFTNIMQWLYPARAKKVWFRGHQHYYLGYSAAKPVAFMQKKIIEL